MVREPDDLVFVFNGHDIERWMFCYITVLVRHEHRPFLFLER
jgi:hypothetical protein